jgi:hypothetical protein
MRMPGRVEGTIEWTGDSHSGYAVAVIRREREELLSSFPGGRTARHLTG